MHLIHSPIIPFSLPTKSKSLSSFLLPGQNGRSYIIIINGQQRPESTQLSEQRIQSYPKPSARNTKPNPFSRINQITPNDISSSRSENVYGLFTKGSKISGQGSCRDKPGRPAPSQAGIKGLTLEDYVRGRTSSGSDKNPPKAKDSSVIKLKYEDTGFCFDQTFEIEEQDEDNYSEKQVQGLEDYNGFLPDIRDPYNRRQKPKHIQTQASDDISESKGTRPSRFMTTYNDSMFIPIHSLGKDKPQLRRSFYRRDSKSRSNSQKGNQARMVRNRSKQIQQLAKQSIKHKTSTTLNDFYKAHPQPKLQKQHILVELGYVTKYGSKFRGRP